MTRSARLRVVKLGGSWLERPGYAAHLKQWLNEQSTAATLVLVGGGKPVDAIRELALVNAYDDECLHWLCIDMLALSLRLVAQQLPTWPLLQTRAELQAWRDAAVQPVAAVKAVALVSVQAFYERHPVMRGADGPELPIGWATTSDSLAALLARCVGADELVLLKSCSMPPVAQLPSIPNWSNLARLGIVDQAFPEAALGLNVRIESYR